jgi:hypothetical protein
MSEQTEFQDFIPENEKIQNIPPFQIGDLVMMRAKALRLVRFHRYPENDIGIVLEAKQNSIGEWLVNIHWQKFIPKNGKSVVKHTRLKKVRTKKNYAQKD